MTPHPFPSRSESSSDPCDRFRHLADQICSTLTQHQIPFRAYEDQDLPHFSALPKDKQAAVLIGLEETLSLYAECAANGESLLDSPRLLWRALGRVGAVPRGDIFDKITDGDIVEVYTVDQYQLFRNLEFFKFVSCTLEELVSFPLWELATYPAEVMSGLIQVVQEFASGNLKQTIQPNMAPYLVHELKGSERLTIEIGVSCLSPVMRDGKPFALITVNRSRIVKP